MAKSLISFQGVPPIIRLNMSTQADSDAANGRWAGERSWRSILRAISLITICVLFTISYVGSETPGYYWDYAGYHDQLKQLVHLQSQVEWPELITHIWTSLQTSDYNVSPVLPLLPLAKIAGDSRLAYILSLVILYLIPSSYVAALIVKECWRDYGRGISLWLALSCMLLYPMFWAPTLRGYPDIAALVPLGIAGLIMLKTTYLVRATWKQSLIVGLLLWLTFLLRRHYAYSVIALIAVTLVFAASHLLLGKGDRRKNAVRIIRNFGLAGFALLLPAWLVQGPLVEKILATSYEYTYAAYQADGIVKLRSLYQRNGLLWSMLALSGTIYAVWIRNTKVLYCLCISVLGYFLFQRTQAPGIHHSLPFFFWLGPAAAWPLQQIQAQASRRRRAGLGALLLGLLAAVSLPVFDSMPGRLSPFTEYSNALQPSEKFPPFRIASYPVLATMIQQLESKRYAQKNILVLASSGELNPSIIAALSSKLAPRISGVGDVDRRDGLAIRRLLEADYIIATASPALHLPAEHQQIILIPTKALADPGSPLAKHYRRISPTDYVLADGNRAYILERRSRPSDEAIQWLTDQLLKSYPGWQRTEDKIGPPQS